MNLSKRQAARSAAKDKKSYAVGVGEGETSAHNCVAHPMAAWLCNDKSGRLYEALWISHRNAATDPAKKL